MNGDEKKVNEVKTKRMESTLHQKKAKFGGKTLQPNRNRILNKIRLITAQNKVKSTAIVMRIPLHRACNEAR